MTDDYNPLINADRYKSRIDMSVIGPMKTFDPLSIPFQSVPIETESEKIGTRLIGIGIGVTRYLDAFPYTNMSIITMFLQDMFPRCPEKATFSRLHHGATIHSFVMYVQW